MSLFALLTTCYELLEEIRGSQESLSSRLETPFVIVCELSPECKYFWLTSELWLFLFSASFPSACIHLKGSGDSQPNFRQLKQTFFFFFFNYVSGFLESETQQESQTNANQKHIC